MLGNGGRNWRNSNGGNGSSCMLKDRTPRAEHTADQETEGSAAAGLRSYVSEPRHL